MSASKELNKSQHALLQGDIIEYILDGYSRSEIIKKVIRHNPNIKVRSIEMCHDICRKTIVERASTEAEEVINLHVIWYENLYKKFSILDYIPGKNAAMRQKEKLLGLLKEDNVVKFENTINVNVKKSVEYDVNKLTPVEQKRLAGYLKLV